MATPDAPCHAVMQNGTWGFANVGGAPRAFRAKPGRLFICTQDDRDHPGQHSACDGHGTILARWPRQDREVYGHDMAHPERWN
jgi:hypothetical protein